MIEIIKITLIRSFIGLILGIIFIYFVRDNTDGENGDYRLALIASAIGGALFIGPVIFTYLNLMGGISRDKKGALITTVICVIAFFFTI